METEYICPKCELPGERVPNRRGRCRECWKKYNHEYYLNTDKEVLRKRNQKNRSTDSFRKKRSVHNKQRRRNDPSAREREVSANFKCNLKRLRLTVEAYWRMHESQNGCCAICKKPETVKKLGRLMKLSVDHDHETNQIRGLLCCTCNRGLGMFKDSAETLLSAVHYLKHHNQSSRPTELPLQSSSSQGESYPQLQHTRARTSAT